MNLKSFLAGVATTALAGALVIPVVAETWLTDITVRMGLNLNLNGKTVQPVDASGKRVPVMLYGSTTYVPIRFISEFYGMDVDWDPNTATVFVKNDEDFGSPSKPPTDDSPVIDDSQGNSNLPTNSIFRLCPPYSASDSVLSQNKTLNGTEKFLMGGKEYTNGFILPAMRNSNQNIMFNLNGKYSTLTFDVGHLDDNSSREPWAALKLSIYLDGEEADYYEISPTGLPESLSIDVTGAKQLIIYGNVYQGAPFEDVYYGLANMLLH